LKIQLIKIKKKVLTEYIATRWYRPPEVLLNETYDKSLDIWSIGCIFAELIDRKVLFQGKDPTDQLELILSVLGTKFEDSNKEGGINYRQLTNKYGKVEKVPWKEVLPKAQEDALNLLEKMLKFEPEKRITAEQALKHKYFNDIELEEEDLETDKDKKKEKKDEPVCKFDFEYEDQELNTEQVRELILHEIMLYHNNDILNEYEEAKKAYIKEEKNEKKQKLMQKKMQKSSSLKSGTSTASASSSKSSAKSTASKKK